MIERNHSFETDDNDCNCSVVPIEQTSLLTNRNLSIEIKWQVHFALNILHYLHPFARVVIIY